MVAVVRPAMIKETVQSLIDNMLNKDHSFRMILNVDPIGEQGKTQEDVVNLIKDFDYFDDVVVRTPPKPHVVKAVRWCLDQAESDLVIFKEDDIKILEHIDLNRMIELLDSYPLLSSLHTDKWGTALDHQRTFDNGHKIQRCGFMWEYGYKGMIPFYRATQWHRAYSFLPNLTKIKFIKDARKYIKPAYGASPTNIMKGKAGNIEGTLHSFLASWEYGYFTRPEMPKQIEDLGKEWKQERGWKKPPKGVWQTWVK